MDGSGKTIIVVFYRSASGREPAREWLKQLQPEEKLIIGVDIKAVEYGWPVGLPLVRKLEKDLWEVRSQLRNCIARVIFTVSGLYMVLLHGFIKKSDKTPKKDLDLARSRMKEVRYEKE